MGIVATRRSNSKGKSNGRPKGLGKLPEKGVRLARVPLSDLVGEAPHTIVNADGWECCGHTGRIHIRACDRNPGFTKACDAIELWASPVAKGQPAVYLDIYFRQEGEPVECYLRTRFDPAEAYRPLCNLCLDVDSVEQCTSARIGLPVSVGEALLQRVFPDVPAVAERRRAVSPGPALQEEGTAPGIAFAAAAQESADARRQGCVFDRAAAIALICDSVRALPDAGVQELGEWLHDYYFRQAIKWGPQSGPLHDWLQQAISCRPAAGLPREAASQAVPQLPQPAGDRVQISTEDLELLRPVIMDWVARQASTGAALGFLLRLLDDGQQDAFRPLPVQLQAGEPGQQAAG